MKTYRVMEVQIQIFSTSALVEVNGQLQVSGAPHTGKELPIPID
jgi:hypothetical protein